MGMDLSYVLRGYEITNTARVIYGLLDGLSQASARNGKPYTYISRESIAKRVGVCEKTVRNALKQLKAVGLITEKRMGRGLNNHIFVFLPQAPQEEKEKKVAAADHSIYQSSSVNSSTFYTNTEKVIKSHIDKSIYPVKEDNAPTAQNKGTTAPKGKPTNKRPRVNLKAKEQAKRKYKEYLYKRLKVEEMLNDMWSDNTSEIEAIKKCIELIANACVSKGNIYVNGALITSQAWWYVVKNITQDSIIELIYKIAKTNNIRNWKAYMLSAIYNQALREVLEMPLYSSAAGNGY